MDSCLYLSSTSVFQGSQLRPVENGSSLDLSCASIVTNSGREDFSKSVAGQKFDTALSYADAPGHHSSTLISQIASCLRPGGSVKVTEPQVEILPSACLARRGPLRVLSAVPGQSVSHVSVCRPPHLRRVQPSGRLCSWQA